jgi:hypothetical protein
MSVFLPRWGLTALADDGPLVDQGLLHAICAPIVAKNLDRRGEWGWSAG